MCVCVCVCLCVCLCLCLCVDSYVQDYPYQYLRFCNYMKGSTHIESM